MKNVRLLQREAWVGDSVRWIFNVKDGARRDKDVTGGTATLRIAVNAGDAALVEKTESDGITLEDTQVICEFNTLEIVADGDVQVTGLVNVQLRLTLGGDSEMVAEIPLLINPTTPAPAES